MKSAILALAALGLSAPAFADTMPNMRSVTVHYADLDLDTAEGRAELQARVGEAIITACGPRAGRPLVEITQCRADAREYVERTTSPRERAALAPETPHRIASNQ